MQVLYVHKVLRPFLPSLGTRGHGEYLGGTWGTRFLSACSSTVCQGRALAKTKPQRRAVSAFSRSCTMALVAVAP